MALLHTLLEAIALAMTLDDVALMRDAIEQRTGQLRIAKDFCPAREFQVGGKDHRTALVAFAAHLKQELATVRAKRHKADFIQHDQILFHQVCLQTQQAFFIARFRQLVNQSCGGVEAHAFALATGGHAECRRQVRLACANLADQQNVFTLGNVFAARQLQNFALVDTRRNRKIKGIERA